MPADSGAAARLFRSAAAAASCASRVAARTRVARGVVEDRVQVAPLAPVQVRSPVAEGLFAVGEGLDVGGFRGSRRGAVVRADQRPHRGVALERAVVEGRVRREQLARGLQLARAEFGGHGGERLRRLETLGGGRLHERPLGFRALGAQGLDLGAQRVAGRLDAQVPGDAVEVADQRLLEVVQVVFLLAGLDLGVDRGERGVQAVGVVAQDGGGAGGNGDGRGGRDGRAGKLGRGGGGQRRRQRREKRRLRGQGRRSENDGDRSAGDGEARQGSDLGGRGDGEKEREEGSENRHELFYRAPARPLWALRPLMRRDLRPEN
jgi:hypothetical protein